MKSGQLCPALGGIVTFPIVPTHVQTRAGGAAINLPGTGLLSLEMRNPDPGRLMPAGALPSFDVCNLTRGVPLQRQKPSAKNGRLLHLSGA